MHRPPLADASTRALGAMQQTGIMQTHTGSDEQPPESAELVGRSSDTAIRTGTCAHRFGDWGSKYPYCARAFFQFTGLPLKVYAARESGTQSSDSVGRRKPRDLRAVPI